MKKLLLVGMGVLLLLFLIGCNRERQSDYTDCLKDIAESVCEVETGGDPIDILYTSNTFSCAGDFWGSYSYTKEELKRCEK